MPAKYERKWGAKKNHQIPDDKNPLWNAFNERDFHSNKMIKSITLTPTYLPIIANWLIAFPHKFDFRLCR